MNEKIKLNKSASVVEYTAARKILWLAGCSAARVGDNLEVYLKRLDGEYSLFTNRVEAREAELYIDEGSFTDMMDIEGKLTWSKPWEELVDFRMILMVITFLLLPKAEHPRSQSIGRGRAQQEKIAGYVELLKDHETIEWIE